MTWFFIVLTAPSDDHRGHGHWATEANKILHGWRKDSSTAGRGFMGGEGGGRTHLHPSRRGSWDENIWAEEFSRVCQGNREERRTNHHKEIKKQVEGHCWERQEETIQRLRVEDRLDQWPWGAAKCEREVGGCPRTDKHPSWSFHRDVSAEGQRAPQKTKSQSAGSKDVLESSTGQNEAASAGKQPFISPPTVWSSLREICRDYVPRLLWKVEGCASQVQQCPKSACAISIKIIITGTFQVLLSFMLLDLSLTWPNIIHSFTELDWVCKYRKSN